MNQRLASFFTPLQYLFFLCVVAGPPAATAEDLTTSSGAQLFKHYCASCHGKTAQGDGPVAPFFKLAPPDLTQMSRRSGGTFPADRARRIIDVGNAVRNERRSVLRRAGRDRCRHHQARRVSADHPDKIATAPTHNWSSRCHIPYAEYSSP